jgi:glycosyltransferase involved in cell wall biosynthesis
MTYSAYVPCYNAAATVRRAVESVMAQTIRPGEILVVDDGSTDGSLDALRGLDVRVIAHPQNLGRGEARARAMSDARHGLVLCCDATNTLEPAFVEKALMWLDDDRVAAVFGRITQPPAETLAERSRASAATIAACGTPRTASLASGCSPPAAT